MSIPKLKVYRLNSGYSTATDDDVQYIENDEILPVSVKNLNPWNTEVMVGVEPKSDARLVKENQENKYIDLEMLTEFGITSTYKTVTCYCDNWVLGQENIYVYVKKVKKDEEESSSSLTPEESLGLSRDNLYQNENWYRVPSNFFRYGITKSKVYYDEYGIIKDTTEVSNAIGFTYINSIYIELGNQLFTDDKFWEDLGYEESFNPITAVRVGYRTYNEFDNSSINTFKEGASTDGNGAYLAQHLRVPFDNIYNGNKRGRIKIEGDYDTSDRGNNVSILEGNYLYKRSIYPLRFMTAVTNLTSEEIESGIFNGISQKDDLVDTNIEDYDAQTQSKYVSDYKRDVILSKSNTSSTCTCTFNGNLDWIIDGDAKPVLMERRKAFNPDGTFADNIYKTNPDGTVVEIENKIFVKLDEGTQINDLKPVVSASGVEYKITFDKNFYQKGTNRYCFPNEVFLFYNENNDRIDKLFDFDYDYLSAENNTGKIILNDDARFLDSVNEFYRKNDLIAVKKDYGYDDTNRFLLLEEYENSDGCQYGEVHIPKTLTLNGKTNEISLFDASGKNGAIYSFGKKIWERTILDNNLTDDYEIVISEDNEKNEFVIQITATRQDVYLPNDLMIVYYEKHIIGDSKIPIKGMVTVTNELGEEITEERITGYENPWCYGYRIVCYQKVKNANLFVSSFPNWVRSHLNNNVDVFVGNTMYSGTDTTNYATDGIYPCYNKTGYAINYSEGSINFVEKVETLDYNDIRNFAAQINSNITIEASTTNNDLKIYHTKVRANYAYYDGLYNILRGRLSCFSIQEGGFWYSLLEDDFYNESVGKRMVIRKDNYLRMIFESGTETLPKIKSSNPNQRETLSKFLEYDARPNEYIKVNTITDRATCINYIPGVGAEHGIIILNKSFNKRTETETNFYNLNNDDIRIHIKIDQNNVFNIGMVSPENTETTNEFLQLVDWNPLPDTEDIYEYENMSLEDIYENKIGKWIYTNETWFYDVVFEIFSYRYMTDVIDGKRNTLSSVELLIYKIDKE